VSPDWETLTKSRRKRALYAREPYLTEVWDELHARWGGETNATLGRLAVVMLKPEALLRGVLGTIADYLVAHGLTPIAWRTVGLDADQCTTIWRYQWNKATDDRAALHVFVARQTPWLLVALRDDAPLAGVPAAVRLWGLKGPTDERVRTPDQLRSAIGMRNRMVGFVHTPDEPADVVREQGILLDSGERADWQAELDAHLDATRTGELLAAGDALHAAVGRHSIDADDVIERLTRTGTPALRRLALAARVGARRPLAEVRAAFGELDDTQTTWDYVVLASELIEHDRALLRPILDPGDQRAVQDEWLRSRSEVTSG